MSLHNRWPWCYSTSLFLIGENKLSRIMSYVSLASFTSSATANMCSFPTSLNWNLLQIPLLAVSHVYLIKIDMICSNSTLCKLSCLHVLKARQFSFIYLTCVHHLLFHRSFFDTIKSKGSEKRFFVDLTMSSRIRTCMLLILFFFQKCYVSALTNVFDGTYIDDG